MTPEEQRALARKHKILPLHDSEFPEYFSVNETDLAAYTAAVEAKERERIAAEIDLFGDSHTVYGKLAEFIRSLK